MDRNMTEGYIWAETFVHSGVTVQKLEDLQDYLNEAALPAVLRWLAYKFQTDQMLGEISSASDRISGLINSIKSYTHMDQAKERSSVDILEGIEGTVTMLGHKFKGKNIAIERHYHSTLPEVVGAAGELNQVWTNLIANAIDAMSENGTLTLEVAPQGNCLRVSVIDNGSGISPENLPYIFDPFFTTKGVNEGTGLGLEIVRSIIVRSHMGQIQALSEPGRTEFKVTLPSVNGGEEGKC
jgi:signal transduction histidine kinase